MNRDQIEGNWKQLKGKAQQQWGKLTDDDLARIAGSRKSSTAASRSVTARPARTPSAKSTRGTRGTAARLSPGRDTARPSSDRTSVVEGKRGEGRLDIGDEATQQ